MKKHQELARRALDWTDITKTNSALADLMMNYDPERIEIMQAMHRMEEWYV